MHKAYFNKMILKPLAAMILLAGFMASAPVAAEPGNYLVEVLVFRHVYTDETALEVDSVRGFHDVLDVNHDVEILPEAPVARETSGGTFDSLRRRLQRLDAYQPLALLVYEQNRVDYHPPVRLHNDVVIAEELHFPDTVIYFDLTSENMLQPFLQPLYQLDGSVQLRRSRFLHIDLDLEYRVEDPAWAAAFPPLAIDEEFSEPTADLFGIPPSAEQALPEPFRIYRLVQSRQVQTDTIQYFDSPFLSALVRVTATEEVMDSDASPAE